MTFWFLADVPPMGQKIFFLSKVRFELADVPPPPESKQIFFIQS